MYFLKKFINAERVFAERMMMVESAEKKILYILVVITLAFSIVSFYKVNTYLSGANIKNEFINLYPYKFVKNWKNNIEIEDLDSMFLLRYTYKDNSFLEILLDKIGKICLIKEGIYFRLVNCSFIKNFLKSEEKTYKDIGKSLCLGKIKVYLNPITQEGYIFLKNIAKIYIEEKNLREIINNIEVVFIYPLSNQTSNYTVGKYRLFSLANYNDVELIFLLNYIKDNFGKEDFYRFLDYVFNKYDCISEISNTPNFKSCIRKTLSSIGIGKEIVVPYSLKEKYLDEFYEEYKKYGGKIVPFGIVVREKEVINNIKVFLGGDYDLTKEYLKYIKNQLCK